MHSACIRAADPAAIATGLDHDKQGDGALWPVLSVKRTMKYRRLHMESLEYRLKGDAELRSTVEVKSGALS